MHEKRKAKLDDLYSKLPSLECKGECFDSCGPIGCSKAERLVIAEYCKNNNIKNNTFPANSLKTIKRLADNDMNCKTCPYLTKDNKCSIYEVRPMVCRLWGIAESMPCIYGCKPTKVLSDSESHELLDQCEWI